MTKILRSIFTVVFAAVIAVNVSADIPSGYYNSINGKSDGDLKNALNTLIKNHTQVSSYNNLPSYFRKTDVRPGTDYWWDMYSDLSISTSIQFGTYMNREHSVPKSWWGGLTDTPAYVDLFHLYPGEAKANVAKSNYPLGEVDTNYNLEFDNGVTKVGYPKSGQGGSAKFVFEPDDEYKGDFARTYFYFVTCYQDLTWAYKYMFSQNSYPTLNNWAIQLLLKWHREDPVSEKETNRNEAVYAIQNNRNPFIDYPELAEYLWGIRTGTAFKPGDVTTGGDASLIAPTNNISLDFSDCAIGKSTTSKLFIKGENLSSNLVLTKYGTNSSMFTLSTTSVAASLANADDGYWLTVTYTPTEVGEHTAKIAFSQGGITGSRVVTLQGACYPVPTLSTLVATDATFDDDTDAYTANWIAPDEVVDYYVVNRTQYVNGSATTTQIVAEENYLKIEGFNSSDSESYTVQSVRLGYYSEPSNVIYVRRSGITGVVEDSPLAIHPYDGGFRFVMSERQTDCRIYDISGRVVESFSVVNDGDAVDLPLGVYFITTAQHSSPLRIAVR
jgi:hypothetical protein